MLNYSTRTFNKIFTLHNPFSSILNKYKFIGTYHSALRYFDLYEPEDHFRVMEHVFFKLLDQNIKQSRVLKKDYIANLNKQYQNIKLDFSPSELIEKSVANDDVDIVFRFEKINEYDNSICFPSTYTSDEIQTIGEKILLGNLVTIIDSPKETPNLTNIIVDLTYLCDSNKIKEFFKKS
jgi:hypothetical protein